MSQNAGPIGRGDLPIWDQSERSGISTLMMPGLAVT